MSVPELGNPDKHHVNSALGWLGLSNHLEAEVELNQVSPEFREHPEVLSAWWQIHAQAEDWAKSLSAAHRMVDALPENSLGWNHLSISLYRTGDLQKAHDLLAEKLKFFADDWVTHYNLACYCCQLANQERARELLEKAVLLGDPREVKAQAFADPDFEPLWKATGKTL